MLLIYLFGTQIFFWRSFLLTMVSLTWLGQIWLNFKKGRNNVIPFTTVFIISLNKLFLPVIKIYIFKLYFRLCPVNFIDFSVDYTLALTLISIIGSQVNIK